MIPVALYVIQTVIALCIALLMYRVRYEILQLKLDLTKEIQTAIEKHMHECRTYYRSDNKD